MDKKTIKLLKNFFPASTVAIIVLFLSIALFLIDMTVENDGRVESLQNSLIVTRVIDGDTIELNSDTDEEIKVRLIGIDTPETVAPNRPVECFGIEASNKMKELVLNKTVKLEADPTQDNEDRYGRQLRYVFLEDDTNINLEMIKGGFANEYTYRVPYKFQTQFQEAETNARENEIGLWGSVCN